MKILVKNTPDATTALFKANVPSFVISEILGKEFETDEKLVVKVPWLHEQMVEWHLPAEAVTILNNQISPDNQAKPDATGG